MAYFQGDATIKLKNIFFMFLMFISGEIMNSEQLIKLFENIFTYGQANDELYKIACEIIENERRKNHHLLAKKLENIIKKKTRDVAIHNSRHIPPIPRDNEKGFKLLEVKKAFYHWNDVILSEENKESLKQIVEELDNEDILASYGLKPKQKILFYGPPGTGKTLSAKVLSSVIGYPFVYVKFEAVISSYLGETAANLRKIFDFIERGRWVVLFDEFDIIGKKRDDPTEHGEIKRVVNNFMLMLENYEGDSIIIASTNHPHILDTGVWRRFDEIVYYELPDQEMRKKLFEKYLRVLDKEDNIDINNLAGDTEGFSGADIEQACIEALKRTIIQNKKKISFEEFQRAINKQKKRIKMRGSNE